MLSCLKPNYKLNHYDQMFKLLTNKAGDYHFNMFKIV